MTAPWTKVRLGDVLRLRRPDVQVEPTQTYRFAGVYSFGRGLFRGQTKTGSEFAYRYLTRLRRGEFVYPKLMAWEGAFGVVPPDCDGLYVSPEFPVFQVDPVQLTPEYLGFYFQIPAVWEGAGKSTGTNVRRRRLHPMDFLRGEIPLPPIAEQRRIVVRIEELAARIEEAHALNQQTDAVTDALIAASERRLFCIEGSVHSVSLKSVTVHLARGRQSEQGESDHFLIKTQHVQQNRYEATRLRLAAHVAAKVRPGALARDGDVLIACSAAGCLGRVARYRADGRVASTDTHVAIARPNPHLIEADYLYAYLSSTDGQVQLRRRERGDWKREKVGFRLTELNMRDLEQVPVPLPPVSEQRRIVAELSMLRDRGDELKHLQAGTRVELNALLAGILDQAVRGEL